MIKNTHDFKPLEGKYVNLREAEVEDAAFILKLRTTGKGAKFLHKTSNDIQKQIEYLERYKTLDNEWYFIVTNKSGEPIGCLGVYDIQGDSVCTGRWVMIKATDSRNGIEGDLLLKKFVFNTLKATELRTDTRFSNKNMINYFRLWGCKIVSQDDEELFFSLTSEMYKKNKERIERFCQ